MPDADDLLIRRLIAGDDSVRAELLDRAGGCREPAVLVAAALVADDGADLLAMAGASATTTRDRQLVAIAAAHLGGDGEVLDVLVREHLVVYPDNVVAAWIAATHGDLDLDPKEEQ